MMAPLRYWRVGMIGALIALAGVPAADAAPIAWNFQLVDPFADSAASLTMAIGTGTKWPKVIYSSARTTPRQLMASSLTPAGWVPTRLDTVSGIAASKSRPGQDGRVGVAWRNGSSIRFAQSTGPGWPVSTVASYSGSPRSIPDVAYLSGNRPVVAVIDSSGQAKVNVYNGSAWKSDTVPVTGSLGGGFCVATDARDNIGVAYTAGGQLGFGYYDRAVGTWATGTTGLSSSQAPGSLAFGPDNNPSLAFYDETSIGVATFDVRSGTWHSDLLASGVTSTTRLTLAFNSKGSPALAYVGSDTRVHYRINEGGGWADVVLPTDLDPITGMGGPPVKSNSPAVLAFDNRDNPVIAYFAQGGLMLAYDPVVVPEPATAALLAGAFLLGANRRSRQRLRAAGLSKGIGRRTP